jgi:formate dehydrogenase major subunit
MRDWVSADCSGVIGNLERVSNLFLTKTAELADVVLPATAAWAESEGTVTNSERRVQRVRKAVEPPPGARDDLAIIFDLANRMGAGWGEADPETVWNEVRRLSRPRRDELCPPRATAGPVAARRGAPGRASHSRLGRPVPNRVPFVPVDHDPPVDKLTDDFPSA